MTRYKKGYSRNVASPAAVTAISTEVAKPIDAMQSFSFGDATPIMNVSDLLDCMECAKNGRWYEPPISPYGLARMFDIAVHRLC